MGDRPWKIGDFLVDLSQRGMIMGILNVTPDSFSDGGQFFDVESAVTQGVEMARAGANIIDIGGESTRPGAEGVSSEEELRRVLPVVQELRRRTDVFLSIDTSKADVAKKAIDSGATMVNDITGGRGDSEMLPLIAQRKVAFIIMHMQGTPQTMQIAPRYDDVLTDVGNFFRQQYDCALECGIDPMAIAFDPGIGFGKTLEHNLELLNNLERLRVQARPLVVGVSRKAFLGKLVGSEERNDRIIPTAALTALLRMRGGDIFRVHDVKENVQALRVAEAMR